MFFLDILSHRMSAMAIFRQLTGSFLFPDQSFPLLFSHDLQALTVGSLMYSLS